MVISRYHNAIWTPVYLDHMSALDRKEVMAVQTLYLLKQTFIHKAPKGKNFKGGKALELNYNKTRKLYKFKYIVWLAADLIM